MFKKIGIKLIVAVAVTALLTISIFAYINIRSEQANLVSELKRNADQLSEVVKSSTEYEMLHNQREHIQETIQRVGTLGSIKRVRVINKMGEVVYSSDTTEVGNMLDMQAESCYKCHEADKPLVRLDMEDRMRIYRVHPDSARTIGIISAIYNKRSCSEADCHAHPATQAVLGVLDVTLPLNDVDAKIDQARMRIFLFALSAIALLSIIITFLVRRWVDKPVKGLLKATRRVAAGDLNVVLKEQRDDELGQLEQSFNNMTQKLSEARMQLFQSDKLASLGRLAAGVAHEINNPLTGVLTYSSFLLKRTQSHPEIQEDLKVIVRETIRSREIVKSLLDFARQSVPKKSESETAEIIARSLEMASSQLSANHITVIKELAPDLPKIMVDANQMQQVFMNLIVNAADAIGSKGGTLTITSTLLSLDPKGITQIKRPQCPKRHPLSDGEILIAGKPSIKLKALASGNEGFVHLDPIYGQRRHQYGVISNLKTGLDLLCPECSVSLIQSNKMCPMCGGKVYAIESFGKGFVEGCTRKECGWQVWEEVDSKGVKEYAEFKVTDTGSGIPREHLPKIFEPFFSTKGQKGNGLGLAVIWGIIDNHNGTIAVESAEGIGTTFIIRIPLKQ